MGTLERLDVRNAQRRIPFWLILLPALVLMPAVIRAAEPAPENCPLQSGRYRAQPVQTQLAASVGETVTLTFSLQPPEPPPGFFITVNMNALQAPEAATGKQPDILTGFPETRALFRTPGIYRYGVVVSMIAKSSCGGVKADTIFKGEVYFEVGP
jgi:hypothetical protein